MFDYLREDLRRCSPSRAGQWRELVLTPATGAVLGYRFRRWVGRLPRPIRRPLGPAAIIVKVWAEAVTNIELPSMAEIGPGLYLPHTGYIVVSSGTVIGRHCTLTQGVTIGHGGGGSQSAAGCPVIGDRVYVGPGAVIIGPIMVGDDALIAPGAVVTRSVPARGVAAGNPARLLSRRGSFDLIAYPGMEDDPARLRSLALRDMPQRTEAGCAEARPAEEDYHEDAVGRPGAALPAAR